MILFQNDTKDCIKNIEPQSGVSIGTLFFGHSGDHYVVIKPWKKVKKMASAFLKHSGDCSVAFIYLYFFSRMVVEAMQMWQGLPLTLKALKLK